jgi:hypothetical protein
MSTITIEREAPQVTPKVTVRDVLHRAADLIEEFGWAQGYAASFSKPGPFCAGTALMEAADDLGIGGRSIFDTEAYNNLGAPFGVNCTVPSWNDRPGRTKGEVITLLREAAER